MKLNIQCVGLTPLLALRAKYNEADLRNAYRFGMLILAAIVFIVSLKASNLIYCYYDVYVKRLDYVKATYRVEKSWTQHGRRENLECTSGKIDDNNVILISRRGLFRWGILPKCNAGDVLEVYIYNERNTDGRIVGNEVIEAGVYGQIGWRIIGLTIYLMGALSAIAFLVILWKGTCCNRDLLNR